MQTSERIDYLDSVRGLAAFSVVIYHFIGWKWADMLRTKLAFFIFNGSDAVSLFFVLSGLVLSLKYFRKKENPIEITSTHYLQYVVNRILRLLPPFIVVFFANYLYIHGNTMGLVFFKDIIRNEYFFWYELILMRGKNVTYTPGWTLGIEIALSFFVPIGVMLIRQEKRLFAFVIGAFLLAGGGYYSGFLFHFALGIWIAFHFDTIKNYPWKESKWYRYRYLIYFLVFALFSLRHVGKLIDFGKIMFAVWGLLGLDWFHFTALGAAGILIACIHSQRLQKILLWQPFLFLGQISYSVYLCHWLIVVYVMEHWDKFLPYFPNERIAYYALLFSVVIATLLSATALYYVVEKPSIGWGKKIAAKFS
ncbi:MAG: acyltransferase family protein [Bacteroidia bacterium]